MPTHIFLTIHSPIHVPFPLCTPPHLLQFRLYLHPAKERTIWEMIKGLDRDAWGRGLQGFPLVTLSEAWRLSVREDAYIHKELRRWGLRMVFLPACMWIQVTAFLSRSSHSDFMSLALAWSQSTAKTVAQPEESPSCTTDRDFPEDFKLAQETPQGNTKSSAPSLLTLPQTVTKWDLVTGLWLAMHTARL